MGHTAADLEQVLQTGPFHLALRAALAVRGLPLERVQHHLAHRGIKVGVTSLSYWQQGARRPQRPESLRAVGALEAVLDLPVNSLLRLLEAATAPGGVRGAARDTAGAVDRLLAGLGAPGDGGLHTVGHHERVRIGGGRELLGRDSQQVVRAHTDGVDRYLAVHRGAPGCDPARVRARAYENCRTGRVGRDARTGVVVAELLFDGPLAAGETYLFGYGFDDGTGGLCAEYVRGFAYAGSQYVLQVRFDRAALPARCRRFAQVPAGAPRAGRRDLTPGAVSRSVHLVEQGVRPGVLGIEWEWE